MEGMVHRHLQEKVDQALRQTIASLSLQFPDTQAETLYT